MVAATAEAAQAVARVVAAKEMVVAETVAAETAASTVSSPRTWALRATKRSRATERSVAEVVHMA